MYPKVHILMTREDCDGEAYVFDRLDTLRGSGWPAVENCTDLQQKEEARSLSGLQNP